uniref:Caspase family p20 domain-containing protein n=1 Tax=Stomoxys calcitrans TaxID=35570 RepID=A0A1I8P4C0_STOCA
MNWTLYGSKKKDGSDVSNALVRQDPRTSVKTTSAQAETTNTTTQNATIFNSNAQTVTYQTTKQTVTSRQTARITEITTRRTPTSQELEEMLRSMHLNKKPETKTFTSTTTTSNVPLRRNRSSNLPALALSSQRNSINNISSKSTPKFKSSASPISRNIFNYDSQPGTKTGGGSGADGSKPAITPTLVKTQTTTVSEKNGRTITQHVEEHKVKFDAKNFTLSTPNSPLSKNLMSEDKSKFSNMGGGLLGLEALPASKTTATTTKTVTPTLRPLTTTTSASTYTSPYNQRQISQVTSLTPKTTNTATSATSASTYTSPYNQRQISQVTSLTPKSTKTATTKSAFITNYKPGTNSNSTLPTTTKPISSFNLTSQPKATTTTNSSGNNTSNKPGSLFSSWGSIDSKPEPITSVTTKTFPTSPRPSFTSTASSMPTSKSKPSAKPGYAYIFNHVIFDNAEERIGSSEDVKALVDTFEHFQMKVALIENAKVDKIRKTVEKIQAKDFSEHACLVIVILSHGNRYEAISAKDGHYSIDDHVLFPILRNSTLNDKPKMFFVQACKGDMESTGYYRDATCVSPPGNANEILKCYSTFEGFVAYRSEKGSIFIQALCKNLKMYGSQKNIKDIMETVTQIVKQQSQQKQIPAYTSTLTKPFKFGDYVKMK